MSEDFNRKDFFSLTIQSGLNAVPYIGGVLSTAYSGYKNEVRIKRLEKFYQDFAEFINQVNIVIPQIHQDVETQIFDLIEELSDKVEREYSSRKLLHFRHLLLNLLMHPESEEFDIQRYFIQTLSFMTELECEILNLMFQQETSVTVAQLSAKGIDNNIVIGGVSRLKSYGFLTGYTGQFNIGPGANNVLNERIELNSFGKTFYDYITIYSKPSSNNM